MSLSPTSADDALRRRLEIMLDRYAQRLIDAAERNEQGGDRQALEIALSLLDKCEALGVEEVFIRLMERFGPQLQREYHLRRIDALFAAVLALETLTDIQRVAFADLRSRILVRLGEREVAQRILDAAWAAAETPQLKAKLFDRQGYLFLEYAEFEEARQAFSTALHYAESCHDLARISLIHNNIGELLYRLEDEEAALHHFEQAMDAADRAGIPFLRASAEGGVGMTLDAMGRCDEAIAHHERARHFYRASADRFGEIRVNSNLAYNAFLRQDYAFMATLAAEVLAKSQALGNIEYIAFAQHRLGQANLGQKCYEQALEHFTEALDLRILIGKPAFVRATARNILLVVQALDMDERIDRSLKTALQNRCRDMVKAAESQVPAAFSL